MNGLKRKPAYSEKELRIVDQKPGYGGFMPPTDLFDTPVSVRENMNSHYFDKDPWYCATLRDTTSLRRIFPDRMDMTAWTSSVCLGNGSKAQADRLLRAAIRGSRMPMSGET